MVRPLLLGLLVAGLVAGGLGLASSPSDPARLARLAQVLEGARDGKQRVAAAIGLARLRDRRGLAPLRRALADRDPAVRMAAAGALSRLAPAPASLARSGR